MPEARPSMQQTGGSCLLPLAFEQRGGQRGDEALKEGVFHFHFYEVLRPRKSAFLPIPTSGNFYSNHS